MCIAKTKEAQGQVGGQHFRKTVLVLGINLGRGDLYLRFELCHQRRVILHLPAAAKAHVLDHQIAACLGGRVLVLLQVVGKSFDDLRIVDVIDAAVVGLYLGGKCLNLLLDLLVVRG